MRAADVASLWAERRGEGVGLQGMRLDTEEKVDRQSSGFYVVEVPTEYRHGPLKKAVIQAPAFFNGHDIGTSTPTVCAVYHIGRGGVSL